MAGITSKLVYYNKLQVDVKVQLSASEVSFQQVRQKKIELDVGGFRFSLTAHC